MHGSSNLLETIEDIKVAFDSLPHPTILKAGRELGVIGLLFAYIAVFLSGRTMRVDGVLSEPRPSRVGVPQRSVLSPFLFIFTLADIDDHIPRALPSEARLALYVDNIAVIAMRPVPSGRRVSMSV
ncbi:hypothetical protein HPB51_016828 [Rhipicephalus microplus]|uniref:Reverse transcriptase domain-containing protein n=1 Tax=Rhipicephalus microplus TaxID=6941 RepID=A0A9J6EHZ9_RHIMP|nr:hypothetical protein HPB51_016828 [Rhipicephalus microplus]